MLKIIPVLDLMNSIAVSGKSGNRENYTPLHTVFAYNSNPVTIADNLRLNDVKEIYIADLDLIEKKGDNLDEIQKVNTILPVMLDCGIKDVNSFESYHDLDYKLIVATETLDSVEELYKIFDKFSKEKIVVSLDIKNNKVLSKNFDISLNDFKKELINMDPNEIILLDISKVGTGSGFNKEIINNFSEFKNNLILGGGITKKEIISLSEFGIKKILVGSSLHNGEIKLSF